MCEIYVGSRVEEAEKEGRSEDVKSGAASAKQSLLDVHPAAVTLEAFAEFSDPPLATTKIKKSYFASRDDSIRSEAYSGRT
jgi:hypothetical protein